MLFHVKTSEARILLVIFKRRFETYFRAMWKRLEVNKDGLNKRGCIYVAASVCACTYVHPPQALRYVYILSQEQMILGAEEIVKPLTTIINKSISEGICDFNPFYGLHLGKLWTVNKLCHLIIWCVISSGNLLVAFSGSKQLVPGTRLCIGAKKIQIKIKQKILPQKMNDLNLN